MMDEELPDEELQISDCESPDPDDWGLSKDEQAAICEPFGGPGVATVLGVEATNKVIDRWRSQDSATNEPGEFMADPRKPQSPPPARGRKSKPVGPTLFA